MTRPSEPATPEPVRAAVRAKVAALIAALDAELAAFEAGSLRDANRPSRNS